MRFNAEAITKKLPYLHTICRGGHHSSPEFCEDFESDDLDAHGP